MHRKGEDICKKCHAQVIYDTYYDPQRGARYTSQRGEKVSETKVGKLKRPRPRKAKTRAWASAANAQRPNDIPDNDDLDYNPTLQGVRVPVFRNTRDPPHDNSDHVIKMRIYAAVAECY